MRLGRPLVELLADARELRVTWVQPRVLDNAQLAVDLVDHAAHEPAPVKYPTAITRSLVEELTGQPFEYEEILPVFENYVRDKKPADVSANTRALADLCLLLFNSNEFFYVY